MAARALITLFRAVNPKLLARKDRGRPQEGDDEREWVSFVMLIFLNISRFLKPTFRFVAFAKPAVAEFVAGAEVLDDTREETGEMEVDDDEDSDESLDISGELATLKTVSDGCCHRGVFRRGYG